MVVGSRREENVREGKSVRSKGKLRKRGENIEYGKTEKTDVHSNSFHNLDIIT